jgi:hypothetical protein
MVVRQRDAVGPVERRVATAQPIHRLVLGNAGDGDRDRVAVRNGHSFHRSVDEVVVGRPEPRGDD